MGVTRPTRNRRRARGAREMMLVATLLATLGAGCELALVHGLDEQEANHIVSVLEQSGIAAVKTAGEGSDPPTFVLSVREADAARALEVLRAHGLPRGKRTGFAEIYGKPSLIPTRTEERARYLDALAGELERTLETIDGVAGARVHLVLEERDPLATEEAPRVPASAAVLLKVHPGPAPVAIAELRGLVAAAVPGLVAERVSVMLTEAPAPRAGRGELVAVGPLRVAPGSRAPLLVGLGVALGLLALLALLLLLAGRRLARSRGPIEGAPTPSG